MRSVTTETRSAPSSLWDISEEKRQEFLSKINGKGKPVWVLEKLCDEELLDRPFVSLSGVAAAKLVLLAELNQEPEANACADCGAPMRPLRIKQICRRCHESGSERIAS